MLEEPVRREIAGEDAQVIRSPRNRRRSRLTVPLLGVCLLGASVLGGCSGSTSTTPAPSTSAGSSTAHPTASSSSLGPGVGPLVSVTDPVPAQPAYPAVVSLAWLDGVSRVPAIRVRQDSVIRWQGPSAAGHAELLAGGAYRWVGADGSMVGCAAIPPKGRQQCVGIDPAGDTGITGGRPGIRVVYGPDGRWLGDFELGGSRAAGPRPTASRAQAVEASGVDLGAVLDFATAAVPFAGGITGDPHLVTAGGVRATSQQPGDFDARTGDPAHQVQVRTEAMPYRTDVGYVTAAVVGASGHRVELRRTGELLVEGDQLTSNGKFRQIGLSDGLVVGWWPPDAAGLVNAVVLWPDGSTVDMSADSALGVTVVAHLPTQAVGGIFGVESGGAHAALAIASVTTTPNILDPSAGGRRDDLTPRSPDATGLSIDQVIASWRVRPGETLFADQAPVPLAPAAPPKIAASAVLAAEKYCAAADMANSADVAGCVFDVARTGDAGYVPHHAALAAAAEQPAFPAVLAPQWPALELGAVPAPIPLDLGGQVAVTLPAADRRVYLVNLDSDLALSIRGPACPDGPDGARATQGAAAVRLFDGSGHPVSARWSPCGTGQTRTLPAGDYYLVLAGPSAGQAADFKIRLVAD